MSYLEKNLIPGEEIVYEARLSFWGMAGPLLLGLVLVGCVFTKQRWALIPMVMGLFAWASVLVKFGSTDLAVTTKRVIVKEGFVARHAVEISLGRVEGIQVAQTFFQRLLNFGTIAVSGTGTHTAKVAAIHDPMAFRAAFLKAVDQHAGGE
jgi:uncharacterized membrane protein YdbT with pleckstrin-like domain